MAGNSVNVNVINKETLEVLMQGRGDSKMNIFHRKIKIDFKTSK